MHFLSCTLPLCRLIECCSDARLPVPIMHLLRNHSPLTGWPHSLCRLIECCSNARLPAPVAALGAWQAVLDENLGHPSEPIQRAAAAALAAFARCALANSLHKHVLNLMRSVMEGGCSCMYYWGGGTSQCHPAFI